MLQGVENNERNVLTKEGDIFCYNSAMSLDLSGNIHGKEPNTLVYVYHNSSLW
jgi:hypothetical protein